MRLDKFILTNFKNYEQQLISCAPGITCFLGKNGMGKTNLLDAIYYLCMGKSHFNAPDSLLARHDSGFFRLEGFFEVDEKQERIVAKVIPRKKKELERNRVPYIRLSEHIGFLPVVMITPDDTYLATDGSEARRRFLDNTISQLDPQYLQNLILYNKLLSQRNALLKQFAEQRRFDASLLQVYTLQMLEPGNAIFEKRQHYINLLQPMIQDAYHAICNGQEKVDIAFRSKLLEEDLGKLLEESVEKDRILHRTTAGPHKDDLIFTIKGYPLKRFASQGQLKSYILALKLAQYQLLQQEKQVSPFLLLDDIFDKLDQSRVSQLLALLLEQPYGQLFITDTDEKRLANILGQHQQTFLLYNIDEGVATKLEENE